MFGRVFDVTSGIWQSCMGSAAACARGHLVLGILVSHFIILNHLSIFSLVVISMQLKRRETNKTGQRSAQNNGNFAKCKHLRQHTPYCHYVATPASKARANSGQILPKIRSILPKKICPVLCPNSGQNSGQICPKISGQTPAPTRLVPRDKTMTVGTFF